MNIQETLTIMRALANGNDPESNTPLEEGSICRRPQTVKALNRAISALVLEEKREQTRPTKAFRSWTRGEDAQVCEEVRQGKDFHDIAKTHDRTVAAIVARLIKLGKITAPPPKAA